MERAFWIVLLLKTFGQMFQIPGQISLDETDLVVVKGLINQEVLPKCVNEETSIERHSYNSQVNKSPQL